MDCNDCKNYEQKPKRKPIKCFMCDEPARREDTVVKIAGELWQLYFCETISCQLGVFGVIE